MINLGTGVNTVTVGSAGSAANVVGAIEEVAASAQGGPLQGDTLGTLTLNVVNGSLVDTNPNTIYARSVNVGANGALLGAADPAHNTNTDFITSGASTFASGARIGLTLLSFPTAVNNTYTVLQTTGSGTLSVGTFGTGTLSDAPWLFTTSVVANPNSIQLTVTQKVALAGAVIVTTPQDVALIDARKGLAMFKKVNVAVIGIIENMSSFVCPHCGQVTDVFKKDGGKRTAELLGTPFLGAIPLDPEIVRGGDSGVPIVVADPDGPHSEAFRRVAEAVIEEVARQSERKPKLSIV